ncbi:ATP-binding protein [Kitasatospora sp. MBT66]|uniref:ATP-binding protein n=1 Tax=Kitasatospora sp. MBT66 TaxID=1444769 RepID=UPI0011EA6968|nr:ATP-binding protein [Kitasatospora sp. MBT66]
MSPYAVLIRAAKFEPVPTVVRAVRRFIEKCCLEVGINPDTPVVLASELATNAIRHAGTPFKVTFVALEGRPVWIEVEDGSLELPRPRAAGPDDLGGRGFELIEALAAKWHTDRDLSKGNKIVCVTLKGDEEDGSGDGNHVDTACTEGQLTASAGQSDLHRGSFPRAVAGPWSA